MVNKVYSMIGLAEKAGNVVSGEFSTEKLLKAEKPVWLFWHRMLPGIPENISPICVLIETSDFVSTETKKNWGTRSERK